MNALKQIRWLAAAAVLLFVSSSASAFPWFALRWVVPVPVPYPVTPTNRIQSAGVEVTWIREGGPADRAGIEVGDVILRVNGDRTRTLERTSFALRLAANERARILMFNKDRGRKEAVYVRVGHNGWIGINGREVPRRGIRWGLTVTGVRSLSPADRAGIDRGDLILRVDGLPVGSPHEFAASLRASGSTAWLTYSDRSRRRNVRVRVHPDSFGRIGVNVSTLTDRPLSRYPY